MRRCAVPSVLAGAFVFVLSLAAPSPSAGRQGHERGTGGETHMPPAVARAVEANCGRNGQSGREIRGPGRNPQGRQKGHHRQARSPEACL